MILVDNIILKDNPDIRRVAEEVKEPVSDEILNTLKEMIEYHERNIYSKNEESDNSISRGQAISEDDEYSDSLNKGKDDLNIRNRTGLDLLMVKNFNERLPEQIIGNNYLSNIEDNDEESESFNQENKNIVDIDNNSRLKKYNLYESEEFNNFKNNFMNQFNKNNNNQ